MIFGRNKISQQSCYVNGVPYNTIEAASSIIENIVGRYLENLNTCESVQLTIDLKGTGICFLWVFGKSYILDSKTLSTVNCLVV